MASWLKAAEDLFEVVDRRAKLVVGERSDEQHEYSQSPASSGQGSQTKRTKTRKKAQKKPMTYEASERTDSGQEQTDEETSKADVISNNDAIPIEEPSASKSVSEIRSQNLQNEGDIQTEPSSGGQSDGFGNVSSIQKATAPVGESDAILPSSNGRLLHENAQNLLVEQASPSAPCKEIEVAGEEVPINSVQSSESKDTDTPSNPDEGGSRSATETSSNTESVTEKRDVNAKADAAVDQYQLQEKKSDTPSMKVQDQLEEAQGLLKTTVSTGQSKEARLARVCAGLSSRLQEYKSENAQLEELLTAERELTKSYESHIKQLQKDLSASKGEITKVESSMAEALAAKNSEIEALVKAMDALKKQAAASEGNLASLQANMESLMRNRELTETRMMQALREELASAERRAEEERAAHNATKMAAMAREVELEHRALEASTALAKIQRVADERTAKVTDLEHKVALLEAECGSLNQELQDMEARFRLGPKKSPEEANQMIQMQAWQDEVERAHQGQRDAENKLASLEAEMQKMRVEMAAMKRDAEHYSRQEHMELEKRYRELTDLLYYKQTQLETMASEKAAAEFQLEKEIKRLQEAKIEAEKSRVPRRASSYWEDDTEIKALEPLPLHHRHMAKASIQLQKAAKLLDSGAVRATRFLWRYPAARVMLLFYLVFVHLFLMYLLHRLQAQADDLAAREVAKSMGLASANLP